MKILIVEDEPSLRELMQKTLAKERYVVETARYLPRSEPENSGLQLRLHPARHHVAGWERFEVVGDAQGTTEA